MSQIDVLNIGVGFTQARFCASIDTETGVCPEARRCNLQGSCFWGRISLGKVEHEDEKLAVAQGGDGNG